MQHDGRSGTLPPLSGPGNCAEVSICALARVLHRLGPVAPQLSPRPETESHRLDSAIRLEAGEDRVLVGTIQSRRRNCLRVPIGDTQCAFGTVGVPRRRHRDGLVGRERDFVSINATTEVDLMCQCASETMAGRYWSSSGGEADFARGAMYSEGGKAFIVLGSTTSKGPQRGRRVSSA